MKGSPNLTPPTQVSAALLIRHTALLLLFGTLSPCTGRVFAQSAAPALEFFRLRPGIPWTTLAETVETLGGASQCRRSSDSRITECRGRVTLIPDQQPFDLIVSLVHDSTAVILLSGRIEEDRLARWIEALDQALGRPRLRTRGSQRTWEWVRSRQMLRISHRPDSGLVVNLTDGPLLDGLGSPAPGGADRPPPPSSTPC